ncbi:hypothetical protein AruPA_13340 [Acidiphilium sp. PA]|uniref:hypothetical protein n=2 Tax=Acidocellaceae TaxID=3385905 RepID=UPI0022435A05|nr:hypothetical protein [Acidiphilium sp. PA]MCW8308026.1 hypothetical protein [Acidiphilium sp. PA]MEE3499901.1 hypothetical protein [Acidiphilium acidophilum]
MKALRLPLKQMMQPRQLSMSLDMPELRGLSLTERGFAVARLATLLMAAAGVVTEETSDDEQ